ncbi:MAG: hypothetical protein AAFZ09_12905, partial [Pseudomonadota bacterium]
MRAAFSRHGGAAAPPDGHALRGSCPASGQRAGLCGLALCALLVLPGCLGATGPVVTAGALSRPETRTTADATLPVPDDGAASGPEAAQATDAPDATDASGAADTETPPPAPAASTPGDVEATRALLDEPWEGDLDPRLEPRPDIFLARGPVRWRQRATLPGVWI